MKGLIVAASIVTAASGHSDARVDGIANVKPDNPMAIERLMLDEFGATAVSVPRKWLMSQNTNTGCNVNCYKPC